MNSLEPLVQLQAIELDVAVEDWRAAIRGAGRLLETNGIADAAYTESMVRSVEEHGPYIVLTPGFALAHARPDAGVARTGLSLVRLREPVAFGHAENDPVAIVAAFAAVDAGAHQSALARLAAVLADPVRRERLDTAGTREEVLAVLEGEGGNDAGRAATPGSGSAGSTAVPAAGAAAPAEGRASAPSAAPAADEDTVPSKNLLLTVCGNGLGTSLFLKNTAEQVLGTWGWSPFLTVEATDTISAKGKASGADAILTSGAIAQTLGDVGVPVHVIQDFTSQAEIDDALRRIYAV